MGNAFRFTLLPESYTVAGQTFQKPTIITVMKENTEKVDFFSSIRAFKREDIYIPPSEPLEAPAQEEPKKITETLIGSVDGIDEKVADLLAKAGFDTAEKILSDDVEFDDLIAIKGIGENTANKVIDACQAALGIESEEGEEEPPE